LQEQEQLPEPLCENEQLLQEEHEDLLHEVQILNGMLDFFTSSILLFSNNIRVIDG